MNQVTIYSPDQARQAQSALTSAPLLQLPNAVARALAEKAVRSDSERSLIVNECNTVLAANQPASPLEVAQLVRRLMNHYRTPDMNEADLQGVIEDWLEDLGPYPFDVLRDAMAAYRQSPKASFKPMPGNIVELATGRAGFRLMLAKRARETLELIAAEDAKTSQAAE